MNKNLSTQTKFASSSVLLIALALSASQNANAGTAATKHMPFEGIACESVKVDGKKRGWFDWEHGSINKAISVDNGYNMKDIAGISTQGISYSIDKDNTHSQHSKHIIVNINHNPVNLELVYESKFNTLRQYMPATEADAEFLETAILSSNKIHLSDDCVLSTKGSTAALKESIEINKKRMEEQLNG